MVDGADWSISTGAIYAGSEGCAAEVLLTEEQELWFVPDGDRVPHVSLALTVGHEAKGLGPMVMKGQRLTDWTQTSIPGVYFSKQGKMYKIMQLSLDSATL